MIAYMPDPRIGRRRLPLTAGGIYADVAGDPADQTGMYQDTAVLDFGDGPSLRALMPAHRSCRPTYSWSGPYGEMWGPMPAAGRVADVRRHPPGYPSGVLVHHGHADGEPVAIDPAGTPYSAAS